MTYGTGTKISHQGLTNKLNTSNNKLDESNKIKMIKMETDKYLIGNLYLIH